MTPTASSQRYDTTKSQLLTTTTTTTGNTATNSPVENRMKIEGSLFDGNKDEVKIAKTNIEHEPTKTFQENDIINPLQSDKFQGKSQFFMSGAPKQPGIESALFLSGAPVIRGKDSGTMRNSDTALSRSNIKQTNNGYTWQQYMPFGNYIWEKQSQIPSGKSTISTASTTSIASSPYVKNDDSNTMRGNIYGNDNRGMLSTNVGHEGAYPLQGANEMPHFASQKQALLNVISTGDKVTETGIARSEIQKSKSQSRPQDSTQPAKKPAEPNTELGIPQVISSEPNQKATSEPLSMLSK